MTKLEKQDLQKALQKALTLVESTVSWVEAKGWKNEQDYKEFRNSINKLMMVNDNYTFMNYMHID